MPKISVLVPCFFNEENIPVTTRALLDYGALFEEEFRYFGRPADASRNRPNYLVDKVFYTSSEKTGNNS